MPNLIDVTGKTFNRLTILSKVSNYKGKTYYWKARCVCGNIVIASGSQIRLGKTKSCGCLKKEKFYNLITKHGKEGSPEYLVWCHIKSRCLNRNSKDFKHYGGRGITFCTRWNSFINFYKDMGNKPSSKHSIDRIDNNKGYSKKNCRWATILEQRNNMRSNLHLKYKGKIDTLSGWCREFHKNYGTIKSRLRYGWSLVKALQTP